MTAGLLSDRSSGILLHITSLPGAHGIGDLGPAAYAFAELLAQAKQQWWQTLPVCPIGHGDSPYHSVSAFAGSPLMISLEGLVDDGLLSNDDLDAMPVGEVDYAAARQYKLTMLRRAFEASRIGSQSKLRTDEAHFAQQSRAWLDDYCLYAAIAHTQGGAPWTDWTPALRDRDPETLDRARRELRGAIEFHTFAQHIFDRQWRRLRHHCRSQGVRLLGDVPIFVSLQSADVWARRDVFRLGDDGRPTVVAGVPPDYFSEDGQLWGNPLYDWDALAERDYDWWIDRLATTFARFDTVRLDHFIGFHNYWEVPADAPNARKGHWRPGPGRALFDCVQRKFAGRPMIAEDLGMLTDGVTELREACGFPGMRVLQFAFDGDPQNIHRVVNHTERSVAYTGTHDNDTARGWFDSLDDGMQQWIRQEFGAHDEPIHWAMIRNAWHSPSVLAITPMQDWLGLDGTHRMNTPGIGQGNWRWRWSGSIDEDAVARLAELTEASGRAAKEEA